MAGDVICRRCGHRSPVGANFCSSCGARLARQRDDSTTVTFIPESIDRFADQRMEMGEGPPVAGAPAGLGVLVVKRGPNVGSRFTLDADLVRAGRHPNSDIFLDDITVSRRHAEIVREGGQYTVRDVGSLNGTYLNRERVESAPLRNGDELQIGTFKLVFLTGRGDVS